MSADWSTTPRGDRQSGDVHVTPIADLRQHELSIGCWCGPTLKRVEEGSTAFRVVHHALDGRELVEAHGVN